MNYCLLVFFLAFSVSRATAQTQRTTATAQSTMTVDDVIKMVQVKLADDLIISQIRKNGKPFSLSADDMVRLKTTGASDSIIRVMVDPLAPATPPAPPDAPTVVPRATTAQPSSPLPSSYGYYILDDQKLSELSRAQVITKFGLTLADRGFAVDGLSGQAPTLRIGSLSPTIIVYQQNVPTNALQLSALSLVRSMTAYQFNIINTAPQFFSNVYRKDPNETIPIDLLRPSRNLQMRIEPVEGKAGMYKLVPSVPLEVGKYALYFPDSLHAGDIVFSASVGRQGQSVLAFEVVPREGSASPSGGPSGGVLYLAKSDGTMSPLQKEEAILKYVCCGGKKVVELTGVRSPNRISQQGDSSFLVSIPVVGMEKQCRVYSFEVKNGKRTAEVRKTSGRPCGVATSAEGQFLKVAPPGDLTPGEYAFGPSDPPVVKGGVKLDHGGGEKVDHFVGS